MFNFLKAIELLLMLPSLTWNFWDLLLTKQDKILFQEVFGIIIQLFSILCHTAC